MLFYIRLHIYVMFKAVLKRLGRLRHAAYYTFANVFYALNIEHHTPWGGLHHRLADLSLHFDILERIQKTK